MKAWQKLTLFLTILCIATFSNILVSYAATCTADRDFCTVDNPFYPDYSGQCTSYVWGRDYEKFDMNLSPGGNGGTWLDSTVFNNNTGKELTEGATVKPNSVAVWGYYKDSIEGGTGHVAFVENVENGIVYFTEANWATYKDTDIGGGVDNNGNKKS